jgi:hypothetical protein
MTPFPINRMKSLPRMLMTTIMMMPSTAAWPILEAEGHLHQVYPQFWWRRQGPPS